MCLDSQLQWKGHGRFAAKRVVGVVAQQMKLQGPQAAAVQGRVGDGRTPHTSTSGDLAPVEHGHVPDGKHSLDTFDHSFSCKWRTRFDLADVVARRIAVLMKIHRE